VASSGTAVRSAAASGSSGGGGPDLAGASGGNARAHGVTRARERDRDLRRAVVRLQGCLGRVPRAERRVLRLRAGVGIDHTRSRADVARITGIRRARVASLERRGLRRLRALERAGACAPASTSSTIAPGTMAAVPVSGSGAPPADAPQSSGDTKDRGQVLAERQSGSSKPAKPANEGDASPSLRVPLGHISGSGSSSSFDFTYVLIPLALAFLAFVLVRELRRTS
jgi:hypothetical protein